MIVIDKELLKARLLKNRVIIGSCWLWKGKPSRQWIGINYKTYLVHRVAAFIWLDVSLDDWALICHKQECPNPGCFNPEHIYKGDSKSNKLDEVALGKYKNQNTIKTHCICGLPYSSKSTSNGKTQRVCNTCKLASHNRAKARLNVSGE